MKIIRSISQMQKTAKELKKSKTIAVVPTMGFLHDGHLSLVSLAKKQADIVVVTIFVNPKQFGPKEDFTTYPRDEKNDLAKLKQHHVDFVFVPNMKRMYSEDFQTKIVLSDLTKLLCGQKRPGHFDGVTLVVNKLFNITQADFAVFGKKDYQQLLVIEKMVAELNMPIKIISGKIFREKDGLAMSSRNAYLTPRQREMAASLYRGLCTVKEKCQKRDLSASIMKKEFLREIPEDPQVCVDYLEVYDAKNLTPLKKYKKNRTLVATAVFVGQTRLIDNLVF
jgi:pantoate--beta-alanine ligase